MIVNKSLITACGTAAVLAVLTACGGSPPRHQETSHPATATRSATAHAAAPSPSATFADTSAGHIAAEMHNVAVLWRSYGQDPTAAQDIYALGRASTELGTWCDNDPNDGNGTGADTDLCNEEVAYQNTVAQLYQDAENTNGTTNSTVISQDKAASIAALKPLAKAVSLPTADYKTLSGT